MVGERGSRRTLGTTPTNRSRLSNITNLVNSSSWSNENEHVKNTNHTNEFQLQQEIKKLQQTIVEKDQEIESQKLFMHKMQREYYANMSKRAQQNEEIIGYNCRLSKELSTTKDQLKLLQHESIQMAMVYKINESELQMRLAETQDQLKRALEEKKDKASYDIVNTDGFPSSVSRRTRTSGRRHSMIGVGLEADIWNPSTNTSSTSCIDSTTVTTRTGMRQKSNGLPQKDSSVKTKIRQLDCASVPTVEPSLPAIITTCPTKRYNNRYGHLNGLETMEELAEESEPQPTASVTSRRFRGHPSFECMSTEVAETVVTIPSSSNGRRNGEVASTSETKTGGAARCSERSRPCEKIPPPARPNTPQRRAASQPTTPRKIHVTPQRKAASQPGTPGSTSPVHHAELPPRGSSIRAQSSSPYTHKEADHPQPTSRMSLGMRPSRRAAECVVSYKEPSLITKMRRPH